MTMLLCLIATAATSASGTEPAGVLVPLPSKITMAAGTAAKSGPVAEKIDPSRADLGDEGYVLQCESKGCRIIARTARGLFYGMQTLEQLKGLGQVPCCTIEDKPAMRMRAVMFDMARLKEKHEYYYHMIDQLAKWKVNTVFLHLTDHNGCAIELKTNPQLATKYAFTQAEMNKLIKYAANRHVELIPEIESWGHATWITSVPELADLAESKEKTGTLCTCNERTWEFLGKVYREVAGLFPSMHIHAGCDEAAFGLCDKCRAKIKAQGEDALVGEHLRRVCDLVKAAGKTPMIWGDVLLRRRGSVTQVPKDAVICHWDYKADLSPEPVEFLKGKGFEVVGCPAVDWQDRMILPMADTWDNVENFAKIVLDRKCLGMETGAWIPQRYMSDTLYPALAHACEMSWSGPARPRAQFMAAFARQFFGFEPAPETVRALQDVHGLSMKAFSKLSDVGDYARHGLETGKLDPAPMPEVAAQAIKIAEVLRKARPEVKSHIEEYDSLILSAEIRAHVEDRAAAAQALMESLTQAKALVEEGKRAEAALELRKPIAGLERLTPVDADLARRVSASWDRWRYADDPKKPAGGDNLAASFIRSGPFLRETLARLKAMADQVEKGGNLDAAAILK